MKRRIIKKILLIVVIVFLVINAASLLLMYFVLVVCPKRRINEIPEKLKVLITSYDGTMLAGEIHVQDGEKWAILVHGFSSDHTSMYEYGKRYLGEGFSVLYVDNRAHGTSAGSYAGMSYLDQFDVKCWIQYILCNYPDAQIILHGQSMGGTSVLHLSCDGDVARHVKMIISDSAYVSADRYISEKLNSNTHLPSFMIMPFVSFYSKVFAGYYLGDTNVIDDIERSIIPILYIHGKEDETVSVDDAYLLYENTNGQKNIYIAENAGHCESLFVDQNRYWNEIFKFYFLE